MRCELRGIILL